jgi:hypothetical protein
MQSIADYFLYHRNTPSDINEHMDTLARYAGDCSHVTEMGVRSVVSTWAFLAAMPRKLVSIDINPAPIEYAQQLAAAAGIELEFRLGDTGSEEFVIEETDLLFIDTWHVYEQLKREFDLHAERARKYIVLHDTTTFGDFGEGHTYDCAARPARRRKGLWPAIEEFLMQNRQWVLWEKFAHNNGLTVLARRPQA